MTQTREQRTQEQFEALLTYLEEEGVIGAEWAESIRDVDGHGQGFEIAEAKRNGAASPPENSGNGGGN